MTVLSDSGIRSLPALVSPLADGAIQPASVDLTLGDSLLVLPYGVTIDPEADQSDLWQPVPLRDDGRWLIAGHRLYLGATHEPVSMPADCVGMLSGVSTLGRLGLQIHVTAGWIDPGYRGHPTLEIVLFGQAGYLRPGMRIAQLTVHRLSSCADRPYRGRYAGDTNPTPARVKP